jgi:hypothetical protein
MVPPPSVWPGILARSKWRSYRSHVGIKDSKEDDDDADVVGGKGDGDDGDMTRIYFLSLTLCGKDRAPPGTN